MDEKFFKVKSFKGEGDGGGKVGGKGRKLGVSRGCVDGTLALHYIWANGSRAKIRKKQR